MKPKLLSPVILLILATTVMSWLAGCSPLETGEVSARAASPSEAERSYGGGSVAVESSSPAPGESAHLTAPPGMVAFEGDLFVATTEMSVKLWKEAGWQIDQRPVDTDTQELPFDCTLYPHQGVENQWVGRCQGYTLIPEMGADHIAVLITNPDGSTTMFQVAP